MMQRISSLLSLFHQKWNKLSCVDASKFVHTAYSAMHRFGKEPFTGFKTGSEIECKENDIGNNFLSRKWTMSDQKEQVFAKCIT